MKRLFSGVKPTGDLHLGNYLGAIKQWIQLQNQYESIFCIVDLHAITSHYKPSTLSEYVLKCACNYLACGLDPEKSVLVVQSQIKAHSELTWILNCLTPISWLERVPTFKEKAAQQADNLNLGLLDYPVLMTADIILYKAEAVPVGEDQLPHIELAREIVRRFNSTFGDTFPEPKGIVGKLGRIKGLDGAAKMGKSLDNCIYLYETKEQIWKKISRAVTDPARVKKTDPGNPEVCNIFSLHKLLSTDQVQQDVITGCTTAGIGCIECKRWLTDSLEKELAPIRDKYFSLIAQPTKIGEILHDGANRASSIANSTMAEVYEKTGFAYNFGKV
jgi:tryptophanyl-tRNA synthetase